jgi:hypothetical protein
VSGETDYLCVGICLPDEDEAYCIGCGRPWGTASVPSAVVPAERDAVPAAGHSILPVPRGFPSVTPTLPAADDDQPATA